MTHIDIIIPPGAGFDGSIASGCFGGILPAALLGYLFWCWDASKRTVTAAEPQP